MNSTSRPGLDHLAGDLVPEHQAGRRGGAAAHHVLVAAADVGGDDLEDHAVLALAVLFRQRQLRITDIVDFNVARPHIDDTAIACHSASFLLITDTNLVFGAPTCTGAAQVARAIL